MYNESDSQYTVVFQNVIILTGFDNMPVHYRSLLGSCDQEVIF